MWRKDERGGREFAQGLEGWTAAAGLASQCRAFDPDVEEEQVAEEERSCYNCRFRRWSRASFTCLGLPPLP